MEFPYGAWLPDQVDYKNPGLEEVENIIPGSNGYNPARAFVGAGTSISGDIIGAASSYLKDGSILIFAATTSDLYVVRSGSVQASSLGLSLASTDTVIFEQFNTEVYATVKGGGTWVLSDIEASNTFAAASGTPPSANAMGRVADFLLMGDMIDIDASDAPYRLRWSQFNNPGGTWGTSLANQSGAIDLDAKYGPITAITGGTYGLVFQRQGITRITFTGGATVFRLDTFEENRGCVSPSSAVQVGEMAYYLAHDGFFRTDGTTPRPISTSRVWDWFLSQVNEVYLGRVAGGVDYQRRCVVWLFPQGSDQNFTGQLWYHWETDRWGYVNQGLQWVVEGAKSGLSLEQVGAIYPDLDAMPLSLDSPEFQPSGRNIQVFSGGQVGNVTGSTLRAKFTTGDAQPFTKRRAFVSEIHPLIEAETMQVSLGLKDRMTQNISQTVLSDVGSIGFAPFNHDGRYFRTTVEIPAGTEWGNAYGYQLTAVPAGVV